MAVTTTPYRKYLASLHAASVNFTTDTIKAMLLTSSYTPNFDTHQYKDVSITNEIVGTGYTAGGVTLGSKSVTYTAANSWGTVWAVGTTYTAGQIVKPTVGNQNGHIYLCQTAGTSHATTEPTWPTTRGATVTDNTVTWEEVGLGITVVTSANPQWTSSTLTARYCAIYDDTPGSNKPLFVLVDFGADVSTTNGTFQVTIDASLGILNFPSR
jgi:hypothetical protein